MLGGADNPNGELLSYIIGADRGRGKLAFSRFRGWTTEQREGVSYDVPGTADQPLLYSAILRSSVAVF